ncbi:MAG TPA: class I SAM-dependent methyltransferase [Thermoleophilaceae bacterium]|jgi:SAM-dependent methyltransferase
MTAIDRALALIDPARRPAGAGERDGYLDLLGEESVAGPGPGQRLMESAGLALIYERLWRPVLGRLLMGAMGPGMRDERQIAIEMLELEEDDTVLDVACGPGNFTRAFAGEADLVVGIDASSAMLARAVHETKADNVAYVRGDASAMPFRDGSFDAVCCFAALYLIEDPLGALDEIARVLAPGGRVALLTSVNRGLLPAQLSNAVVRPLSGVRVFGREEITSALRGRGLTRVAQRVSGLAQFVSAVKPATPAGGARAPRARPRSS